MFKTFKKTSSVFDYDFSTPLFPDISDREFWSGGEDEIAAANEFLDYGWPVIKATDFMEYKRSGDRLIMENIHFERRTALVKLVIGEAYENKGRFLPQIVNGIFAICEETFWGVSAHWFNKIIRNVPDAEFHNLDLFAAETAEHLSGIYYILNAPLSEYCPEILRRIEYELHRRIFKPYLTHIDYMWQGYVRKRVNNWNPWILSNILTAYLLVEKNETNKKEAINKMFTEIQFYYDSIADDGGCDEGPSYWGHAGAMLFDFIYLIKLATAGRLDLTSDEKFKKILLYITKVYIANGRFVNFSDGPTRGPGTNAGTLIYVMGKQTGQIPLCALGSELAKLKPISNRTTMLFHNNIRRLMLTKLAEHEALAFEGGGFDDYSLLDKLQVCTMRKNGWYFGIKGGHNKEQHNHNDVASYVLYDGAKPVVIDPGVGDYTKTTFSELRYTLWTMNSGYHNLPDINGIMQKDGEQYRADGFECEYSRAKVSFAGAYTEDIGIKSAVRTAELCDDGLTVEDVFDVPCDVCEHIMLVKKPEITEGKAIIGDHEIVFDGAELSFDEISIKGDSKLTFDWETDLLYRLNAKYDNCKSAKYTIRRK